MWHHAKINYQIIIFRQNYGENEKFGTLLFIYAKKTRRFLPRASDGNQQGRIFTPGKGKTEQMNIQEQQNTDVLKLNRVYEGYTKGGSPSQDGRTSHGSSSQNPRKMLRKQSPKVTTRSKHKRRSFEGRIGRGEHRNH